MARPRKSAKTKERLLETGATLLLERGYHGTGIKDVLDEVGVPKGSFYNYFESKEDFGVQVIRHFAQEFTDEVDTVLAKAGDDALGALRRFFGRLRRDHQRSGFGGGCLVANLGAEIEDIEACRLALVDALSAWRDRLQRVLAIAQQQGSVREDRTAGELASFLLDAWEGALIRSKIERSPRPLKRCVEHLFDDYLRP